MSIRKPYQILLLWLIVLGVYYPAIFSELNSVDDQRLLYSLEDSLNKSWLERFLPPHGFYYRPLLILTFRIDYLLWEDQIGFYHLENILLHGASATLIFFILRHLLCTSQLLPDIWPLLGALLFALHPIATESVNWISGRTDLLGAFFVLAATLVLLKSISKTSFLLILMVVFLMGCAAISKEVMIFFIPAAAFLLWRWSIDVSRSWRRRAVWTLVLPFLISGAAFVALRWLRHGVNVDLTTLIYKYPYGFFNTARISLKVFGFYGKKLIAPLPLNFAIVQADDLYVWLGILLLVAALGLFILRRSDADLILVGWFLILPGILIALFGVAWTPLAERYIYLSSAFFVMGVILFFSEISILPLQKNISVGVAFLLVPVGAVTIHRNFVWQDNTALYSDTIKKSPQFAAMNNELAIALADDGRFDQARQLLDSGKSLRTASALLYINQARILMLKGDIAAARDEMMKICSDKTKANAEALKMLIRIDEKRLMSANEDRENLALDLIDSYSVLIEKTKDPHLEYRVGQLFLSMNKPAEAGKYFGRAYEHAPAHAFYREAAGKLAGKLLKNGAI